MATRGSAVPQRAIVRRLTAELIGVAVRGGAIADVLRATSVCFRRTSGRGSFFGEDRAAGLADRIDHTPASRRVELFPEAREPNPPKVKSRRKSAVAAPGAAIARSLQETTLDRTHAAMLLQAGGRTNALHALISAEQERSPDFLRLANPLSAIYSRESNVKRLLDAIQLTVPR